MEVEGRGLEGKGGEEGVSRKIAVTSSTVAGAERPPARELSVRPCKLRAPHRPRQRPPRQGDGESGFEDDRSPLRWERAFYFSTRCHSPLPHPSPVCGTPDPRPGSG
jgi:hypothetical protein